MENDKKNMYPDMPPVPDFSPQEARDEAQLATGRPFYHENLPAADWKVHPSEIFPL